MMSENAYCLVVLKKNENVKEKTNMTKELSIKTIKEKLANALINDARIIKSLPEYGEKKTSDYIGSSIFGYIDDEVTQYCCAKKYISFDVVEGQEVDDCFKVIIELKAHKDLLGNSVTNCLDDISEYVKDIVKELFPYYKHYSNTPKSVEQRYAGRSIEFDLYEKDAKRYARIFDKE